MRLVRVAGVVTGFLIGLTAPGCIGFAAAPPVDKSSYSVFNPVPDDKLRAFSTDRPGKSHSALTVDAGRVQVESDFLNYTYDPNGLGGTTTNAYSVATPILKVGLTNWMDLELGLALFNSLHQGGRATSSASGSSNAPGTSGSNRGSNGGAQRGRGFGDTLLGTKVNLFGNDSGDQSLALLPFIKFPTAARGFGNDHVEFTLNAPYTTTPLKPWSLTLEPNFGILRNLSNTRYRENYGLIANLNRPVFVEALVAAAEVAVDVSSERGERTKVSFDPSLQYLLTNNLQLDVGAYLGLNKATPRYNPYFGISYRF